jgi:hypothetical protein
MNQDTLENNFGAFRSYRGANNNPTVGQFVDDLNPSIISGLAFRGMCESNCEDDDATLLDNLQSLLKAPDATSQNPSPVHDKKTLDAVPESSMLLNKYRRTKVLQYMLVTWKCSHVVAYVSGSIGRQVLRGASCDACKTFLTSEVLL